jgi:hypothetical protein
MGEQKFKMTGEAAWIDEGRQNSASRPFHCPDFNGEASGRRKTFDEGSDGCGEIGSLARQTARQGHELRRSRARHIRGDANLGYIMGDVLRSRCGLLAVAGDFGNGFALLLDR